MHTCVVLKPCEITNMIYFFVVLGGHYLLFLEVDADEKERMLVIISSLEHLLSRYQKVLILKIIASY